MSATTRKHVLLAHAAEEKRLDAFPPSFLVQPKLRGVRARVVWRDGIPILLTSYGNIVWGMDHIQGALYELPRIAWDGELYVHGWSQEEINSVVKRKPANPHPRALEMQYHIFDLYASAFQSVRIEALEKLLHEAEPPIFLVPSSPSSKEEWLGQCSSFLKEGYEGIILRHPNGLYVSRDPAYRSPHLLKYKPRFEDTYKIVGTKEGEGWARGMLGAFLVTSGEKEFWVGTGPALTKLTRKKLWSIKEELIGLSLRVKHEPIQTVGGFPICTVAVEVLWPDNAA